MATGGTPSTRARAPHLGPERRRPLVLDAALQVYLRTGFEGASMDAIAAEAGVTKPVLYDCYPNKRELFVALLRREAERLGDTMAAALPDEVDLEHPAATLTMGFVAFFHTVAAAPDSYRAALMALHDGLDPSVAAGIQNHREVQVRRVADLTTSWMVTAGVPDPEAQGEVFAHAVAGVADSFARMLVAEPGRFDPEELGRTAATLLLRGFEGLAGIPVP